MFKSISKSDDKQQKISKLVIYISNFKVLTDPLKTFRGPPGVRGPPVENHWSRGFEQLPSSICCPLMAKQILGQYGQTIPFAGLKAAFRI